jgi:hypothetical protein
MFEGNQNNEKKIKFSLVFEVKLSIDQLSWTTQNWMLCALDMTFLIKYLFKMNRIH